jgi:uncharacterized ion transporter superfamily protein YfcC
METKAGIQISRRAFIQSAVILLALMVIAGVMTRTLPAGQYDRQIFEEREVVLPGSFEHIAKPDYPVWRWFTAPVEVLFGPEGITVIAIILFILFASASFAILESTGLWRTAIHSLVERFSKQRYRLLLVITFFFMLLGSFFGVFEEIVPLVPLMVSLSLMIGWDSLTGLGMSVLATNMGFTAAIANPFTLGVAQGISGLPLFSGALLRAVIFLVIYAATSLFLVRYARRIEAKPESSPVWKLDEQIRTKVHLAEIGVAELPHPGRAIRWLFLSLFLIVFALIAGPYVPAISGYTLPIVGLLFLTGGLGAGLISGFGLGKTFKAAREGISGVILGIPLVLMAVSIKHIVEQGGILDTILHSASEPFVGIDPFLAIAGVFLVTLLLEIFVPSGSAKAFLLMPILVPLADIIGTTRQTMVLSYILGDGFSNMAYPTNPVLIITLSLTVVSYPVWIRWTARLWLAVLVLSLGFLGFAVAVGYGPF